ncbi:MAG: menaquinone biosynthesis protein [bacterium]|nr:menaquinone biosynthesis protein [bacterium]
MRLGAVPYLNVLPLIHSLNPQPRLEVPARLVDLLEGGELDVALAPVVALFKNKEWKLVDGLSISTQKAAGSVRLTFERPGINFQNIRQICLGTESRTSVLLLQTLLRFKYGRNLEEIRFERPLPYGEAEGRLLIGDQALGLFHHTPNVSSVDLGLEWTSWTKLPFVFAAWISRHPSLPPELVQKLKKCLEEGLKDLDSLIERQKDFSKEFLRKYFTENLFYGLGKAEKEGVILFHSYAVKLGEAPEDWKLSVI